MEKNFQAFRRNNSEYFYVLDQLKLPNTIEEIKVVTIEETWKVIKNMNVRGAPLIAVVATQGLRNAIYQLQPKTVKELKEFTQKQIEYIRTSRTTAVNLQNDTQEILEFLQNEQVEDINAFKEKLYNLIDNFNIQYIEACYKMAKFAFAKISEHFKKMNKKGKLRVLTICNTGKLATPGEGTALGIVREINRNGMLETLYITETRPYNQGARLTATEALQDNLPAILITDNMVGALMFQQKVDLVITGADRVAVNGDTANKIGTYQLAVLSKYHDIPFYVALPSQTICKKTLNHKQIKIEERPKEELTTIGGFQIAPNQINVWNPSFDVTPSELITSIFHEKGEYEFDRELGSWEMLTKESVIDYCVDSLNIFENKNELKTLDVGDGNLNLVFAVSDNKGKSIIIKQALPYVKCIGPSWPFSLSRSYYESKALQFEQKYAKELIPEFVHYEKDRSVIAMEYLGPPYVILRTGLIELNKYQSMSKHVSQFIAKTTFFSSSLHLNNKKYRENVAFWCGNHQMCELTEQVIFSDPYVEAPLNRWTTPLLDEIVDTFKSKDPELILAVVELRNKFITLKQALIHGDLHTGSIMVTQEKTKMIDPEFAFYGPIGFDTGAFVANLFINYFSLKQYGKSQQHVEYGEWIVEQVNAFYQNFEREFLELWNQDENVRNGGDYTVLLISKNSNLKKQAQQKYLKEIFFDTLGFTACKIIRRIIGVAHVQDFEGIKDDKLRAQCEHTALLFARDIMVNARKFNNIQEVVANAKKYYNQ